MSIRREQEHVSLALTAVVSIARRIGALQQRRQQRATADVTLRSSDFSVFRLFLPVFYLCAV
jgi:hypothetical protein